MADFRDYSDDIDLNRPMVRIGPGPRNEDWRAACATPDCSLFTTGLSDRDAAIETATEHLANCHGAVDETTTETIRMPIAGLAVVS